MPFPLGIFGTASAAGGSGGSYSQNLVDTTAPAYMRELDIPAFWTNSRLLISVWVTWVPNGSNQFLLEGIQNNGQQYLRFSITNAGVIQCAVRNNNNNVFSISTVETLTSGTFNHILANVGQISNDRNIYVNDVEWTWGAGQTNNAWRMDKSTRWGVGNRATVNVPLESPGLGDFWADENDIDIDVEANRRLFSDENGDPVDLGTNGEIPLGTAPLIFFGSDYKAAEWNSGVNLGTGTDFTVTGTYVDV